MLNCCMKNLKEDVGRRIKEIREGLGLTLEGFGKKLCLGKTAIHQYEHGISTPSLETLAKIAELGNVTIDWLITGKEPANPHGNGTTQESAGSWNQPNTISPFEQLILEEFRAIDPCWRHAALESIACIRRQRPAPEPNIKKEIKKDCK